MRHTTPTLALLAATVLTCAAAAPAEVVTLKQGLNAYAGTDDTTLIQNFANGDYGGRNEILLGPTGSGQQRSGVIRFDVTSLANQYQSIDSIKLRFWVFRAVANNSSTFNVNLLREGNADWVEGTDAGGAVNAGVATWNSRQHNSVQWLGGTSGARLIPQDNYGSVASFTLSNATPVGTLIELTINPASLPGNVDSLTEIIDLWTQNGGADNAGFNIYGGTAQWGVDSSESGSLAERPELVITFTPVPTPAALPAGLALLALAAIRRRRHLA